MAFLERVNRLLLRINIRLKMQIGLSKSLVVEVHNCT